MKLKLKIKKNLDLSYNASKKRSFKKNDINNKSMINPTYLLSNIASKEFELKNNDISALSNANLNIIKILSSYANEDIINGSSYLNLKNDNQKGRSSESKKYCHSSKENAIYNFKNVNLRMKSKKSNHILNSKSRNFNSDSITKEKINNIKSPNSYKEINKLIFSPHIVKDKDKNNISEDKSLEKSHHIQKFSWKSKHNNYPNSPKMKLRKKEKKLTIQEKSKPFVNQNIQFRQRNSCFVINNDFKNHNLLLSPNHRMKMKNNYMGLLNELEITKINENIQKDINFIELRKKISKLKNMMLLKNNKYDSGKKSSNSLNNIHAIKENGEHSKEAVTLFKCKLCKEKSNISKRMSKEIIISNRIYKDKDRNRLLFKKDNLYDYFDDEDYINEQIGYYIKYLIHLYFFHQ